MAWATFSIQLARENLRATQILLEMTEALRTFTWDQLNTTGFVPTSFTAPYADDGKDYAAKGMVYNGIVSIKPIPTADRNYTNDLRLVTINLSWSSGGLQRNRQVITYVAR